MRVGYYQFDIQLGKKKHNLKKVYDKLIQYKFDLIVLPELFNTGYLFSSKDELLKYAEDLSDSETINELKKIAHITNSYIVGSIVEKENNKIYNTAILVGKEGLVGKYRKMHLTTYEKQLFDEGDSVSVFEIYNIKIGIMICYDCWFSELSRILTKKGAQIIVHPSNFGGKQSLDMIRIRSLENMVYTITANRLGIEKGLDFNAEFRGESQIVDIYGEVITQSSTNEDIQFIEIDPEKSKIKKNVMCNNLYDEINKYELKLNK